MTASRVAAVPLAEAVAAVVGAEDDEPRSVIGTKRQAAVAVPCKNRSQGSSDWTKILRMDSEKKPPGKRCTTCMM